MHYRLRSVVGLSAAAVSFSLLASLALAGCSSIRSGLEIDPGATFVLGGGQRGAFRVEALNTGDAAVRLLEVTASRDTLAVASLRPGERADADFAAGSAALLVNDEARPASLDVRISGDTNLGMRYTPAPREPPSGNRP